MECREFHQIPGGNPAEDNGSPACTGYLPASQEADFLSGRRDPIVCWRSIQLTPAGK